MSDKSARQEFGLAQEEIIQAMRDGKLQFRNNYMHGNPYFRLLRSEVEALVDEKYGAHYLKKKKLKTELSQIDKKLRKLRAEVVSLEKRKAELLKNIGE